MPPHSQTMAARTTQFLFCLYLHLFPTLPTSIVLNQIQPTSQLQHISQLGDPPALTNAPHTLNSVTCPCRTVLFRGRIPPIQPKLHNNVTKGHYVDMAELCPKHLEALNEAEDDHIKSSRSKLKDISSILNWVQAFSIYVAVLPKDQPHRVQSLLVYQHLLIHSHSNFKQFN